MNNIKNDNGVYVLSRPKLKSLASFNNKKFTDMRSPSGSQSAFGLPFSPISINKPSSKVFNFNMDPSKNNLLRHISSKNIPKCSSMPLALRASRASSKMRPLIPLEKSNTCSCITEEKSPLSGRKVTNPGKIDNFKILATHEQKRQMSEISKKLEECQNTFDSLFTSKVHEDEVESKVIEIKDYIQVLIDKLPHISIVAEHGEIMYQMFNMICSVFNAFNMNKSVPLAFQLLYNVFFYLSRLQLHYFMEF